MTSGSTLSSSISSSAGENVTQRQSKSSGPPRAPSSDLDVARRALESVAVEGGSTPTAPAIGLLTRTNAAFIQQAIPVTLRQAALHQVDQDLVKEGLLDKVGGAVSPAAQKALGFEKELAMPTPGIVVKGCLDDCDICEPELKQEMALDLVRKDLENQLLKRKIELLDKSHEYRCCPAGEVTSPAPHP